MSLDASLQQNTLAETNSLRPVWSAMESFLTPAATNEAELGYECALPWTLGQDMRAEVGQTRY